MSVPVGYTDQSLTAVPQSTNTSNWTIDVSDIRTIKVSNISLGASDRDIKEFFSFSGDVQYVEMQRETETTQLAYVTFKDSQGADTAILLSGATIADLSVTITPVEDYHLPPEALSSTSEKRPPVAGSAVKKAEDVVSTMLAKGFVLGKDAINKAKSFDERHHFSSNASATVASIDQRMGLTGKLSIGTAVVNEKMREMDERFRVSEKTNLHLLFVEQKASSAGSAIMGNRYVSAGASWVSSAFSAVVKAAEDVSMMTKEKVEKAEEEKKEILYKERTGIVRDFAHIHLDDSPAGEPPIVPVDLSDSKLGII
ncbi:RRM_1 domain-containing protein [Cephalotus follicularis]|uniref:RRM_1 domain-containing protein n=1 Tax=Cephalotus follicularis TaxID=3775 RepID=A0A1Q3D159_CEPFO|nr:RRM_1 domain-containing protein [Cephalotus follicularis]